MLKKEYNKSSIVYKQVLLKFNTSDIQDKISNIEEIKKAKILKQASLERQAELDLQYAQEKQAR